jgi:hypothetical protein
MDYRSQFNSMIATPNGKVLSDFSQGGLVKGHAHSQGGVATYKMQEGGGIPMEGMQEMPQEPEQIAEVEGGGVSPDGIAVNGGERIFSVEDTQQIEAMASQYMQTQDQQLLMQLGQFVVDAMMKQEQVNPSGEDMGMDMQGMEEQPMEEMPMQEQPMMKFGGKLGSKSNVKKSSYSDDYFKLFER